MKRKTIPLKPVSKGSAGKGISGKGLSQFTNAEQIRNRFSAFASGKRAGKESGDAGGEHTLAKDSQSLADFANSVANISNEKQNLTLAVNEQEFNNKKQQLINKLQECINKCETSDYYSKFQADLNQLRGIEPKHQKEVLQLEAEIRGAEAKYNEAMANAAKETDPAKKAQFIAIAQGAERTIKQTKQKLTRNPLSKYVEYSNLMNYVNDLEKLIKGNVPSKPPTVPNPIPGVSSPGGSGGGTNPTGGGSSGSNNQQSTNQQQLLIFAGIAVLTMTNPQDLKNKLGEATEQIEATITPLYTNLEP
ncbi:15960_t:CDS:2 [Funneliformis geosporum]|uniref:15960_t:CDS:1 n=1 Tax=Funneliformis geosporum TaxID=1117311 RepID=A0A9W4WTK5_9GLOM|nr:15960_t:CDS:2 [Funneliformis geosporum]